MQNVFINDNSNFTYPIKPTWIKYDIFNEKFALSTLFKKCLTTFGHAKILVLLGSAEIVFFQFLWNIFMKVVCCEKWSHSHEEKTLTGIFGVFNKSRLVMENAFSPMNS